MSQARLLVRAVTVRPAATTADRAHGRALLLGLRSRYVVPVTAIDEDADGWVVHYDAPATLPTLAERLAAGRGLSLAEAVRLAADVAWGLAAGAAAGLVHGRLDATQIALGEGPARVVGLGLDALDAAPPAGDGIAPEVRAGGPPTEAADLWSLGVLLRDLTGGADLPLKLADLLGRMLDPHPSRRPASARAVATRLVGMRIAAAHVDPGPRRPAAGAGEARPVPPSPPSPPINLPPAPRPSAATVLPGSPPPVPPVPVPPVPPPPMPRLSALRRPHPPAAPPADPGRPDPDAVGLAPVEDEIAPPVAPADHETAERGTRARAVWRRGRAAPAPEVAEERDLEPEPATAAEPMAEPEPEPEPDDEPQPTALPPPLPVRPEPAPPAVPAAPAEPATARHAARPPSRGRRPLAIAVTIAVLIAAAILIVLATRGSSAPAHGAPAATPASAQGVAPRARPAVRPSVSRPVVPLPIVAATAPVDPAAVDRLRALALAPTDVGAGATALAVPEESDFDAVLRALYAECDYFTPVGSLPLAHLFTGFADGATQVFDDLTTYPTGVAAQVVEGVATAIRKCPTIKVSSGNPSEAPAEFAVNRLTPPSGVPADAVALTYERTDEGDDDVRAVFLSTGTTLRVVLALGPSLAATEGEWDRAAARAWQRLTGSH